MKKGLYGICLFAAVALLARLPHPAKDISLLAPVQTVWLHREGRMLCLDTDTGGSGRGEDLLTALMDMRSRASGEIFLETAEYLLLDPEVTVTEELFDLLRPGCRVVLTDGAPDLEAAADFLEVHRPNLTLAHLRAEPNRWRKEPP